MSSHRPLQGLVDFTDHFRRLPPLALLGFLFLVSGAVAWAWGSPAVGLGFGLLSLGDWVMLAALPRLGRSFGPPQLAWLSLATLRLALALLAALLPRYWALPVAALIQCGVSLAAAYACWVEPARLGVTCITLRSSRLNGCPPLRLLHISDLHVERITARERHLLDLVKRLAPDVIVITGDYLNISYTYDGTAQRHARELLAQLKAAGGVYAITGSPSVESPELVAQLLSGLDVTWLRDEVTTLTWHSCRIQITGMECSYDIAADERRLLALLDGHATDCFTVLLYHTPDVMPAAVRAGVNLYLAGHTHGGQLRLPFFGALVTASNYGKRYEMGLYEDEGTTLYVSRGVGMEGYGAPRARFLCPPEVVLFKLMGEDH
jgi:predicted MPP superfamily phosphohydrolase